MGSNTIISYQPRDAQTSYFLNINQLLKCSNIEKIKKIYEDVYYSVTAYDVMYVNSLKKVEKKLYTHIIQLATESRNGNFIKKIINFVISFFKRKSSTNQKLEEIIKETNDTHLKFSKALEKMQERAIKKEPHSKPLAIKKIEEEQIEHTDVELFRLNSIPRVENSLNKILNKRSDLSKSQQIAIGRSIELYEQLKNTHYIINHGQNLELMIINIITRQLKNEFESKQYESFETLRHDTSLSHIQENVCTVEWYQKEITHKKGINDHKLRRELICGDCVLESTSSAESAIDFFAGKTNIAKRDDPEFVKKLLLPIIQDYIPKQEVANKLCEDLLKLMSKYSRMKGGNLYSICVPKNKFDESCYFSLPFGVPLQNQKYLKANLTDMQSGQDPCGYPQIRILSHKIRAQDGYHVILNSTLKKKEILKIENDVSLCIQTALTGYRIHQ